MSARKPIRVLRNAAEVIRLLGEEGAMTPAEIAERLGVPRPSIYRLLDGLHAVGLTEPDADAGARLGIRWLHLADRASATMVEWEGAHALLEQLVERTHQTVYLSVLRGDEVVCIDWEQGRGIGVLVLKPGGTLPLNAGAAGRAMLAFGVNDVDRLLAEHRFSALTPHTPVSADELRADIDATRARGYSVSDEDVTVGVGAIGAPLRDGVGKVVGVLSIAGLATQLRSRRDELVEELFAGVGLMERLTQRPVSSP